jgi:hypothetical protein
MKPNQNKGKLQLKKQVVSNLTSRDLEVVKAGYAEAELTTSYGSCTGRRCCDQTNLCTIWEITTIILTKTIH